MVQGVFFAGLRDNQRMDEEMEDIGKRFCKKRLGDLRERFAALRVIHRGQSPPIAKPRDTGTSTNLAKIASSSTISRYLGKPSCSNRCCIA